MSAVVDKWISGVVTVAHLVKERNGSTLNFELWLALLPSEYIDAQYIHDASAAGSFPAFDKNY